MHASQSFKQIPIISHIYGIFRWICGHEGVVLASLFAVLLAIWGFAEIADEVLEGSTQDFDEWVIIQFRQEANPAEPIGPSWLKQSAVDITALGGKTVLLLLNILVVGYLILNKKFHASVFVIVATVSGTIVAVVLKESFGRERPDVVEHLTHVTSASFPSGHSMMSAVVYLTLGALLARMVTERRAKVYFLGSAIILTLMIGVTRVYLGVHFPTDVLAGWCAGFGWAALCWVSVRHLQKRGAVEKPEPVLHKDTSDKGVDNAES